MRALIWAAISCAALTGTAMAQDAPFAVAKCDATPTMLATLQLPQDVLADGKRLTAGVYQVRLTIDRPPAPAGQSAAAACWVEFVRNGSVAGHEIATVISAEDIGGVAKGPGPKPGAARVDVLKGGEYVRAWINRGDTHYIINLPAAAVVQPPS